MPNLKSAFCSLVCISLVAAPVLASPLTPGTSINAASEPDPQNGAVVGAPLVTPLVGSSFTATLTSTVISGDTTSPYPGGLTFIYELANSGASADPLGRVTVTGFNGWLTDVSYQTGPGRAPTIVDRTPNGNVVGFSFFPPPQGTSALLPGETSTILVIQTNAPGWVVSTGNVINGAVVSGPAYGPIPEPATLALLTLAGCFGLRRR